MKIFRNNNDREDFIGARGVARLLGVSTSAVVRAISSLELPQVEDHM